MFECLCENHLHQRTKCRIKSMDDRIIHFNLKPGQADYFTGHYRPFNFKWNVAKRKNISCQNFNHCDSRVAFVTQVSLLCKIS